MEIVNIKERPDFIPTVASWIHEEWGHIRSRTLQEIIHRLEDGCATNFPFTVIAILNGEPVGTAALKAHDMDILHEYTPWLAGVYVPTIHRRKNIGSTLIAAVERRAKDLGFENIYLFTDTSASLYGKLGWIPLHQLEYDAIHVVVMQKALREEPSG